MYIYTLGKTYLGVVLDSFHGLLLRLAGASAELSLQALLRLLFNLPSKRAIVVLLCLSAHIQCPIVLLHRHQSLRLAHVRTDELGVPADSLVAILHRLRECHELDERCSSVGVATSILGSPLRHLREGIDRCGPVCLLEFLLSQFAGLFGLGWVDVGFLFSSDLGLFGIPELGQSIGGAVLSERPVVVLDGLSEITELLIGGTNPGKRPAGMSVSVSHAERILSDLTWRES